MIETNIESPICTWAEDDGWEVRKLRYVKRNGAPDRMFYKAGRVVFIEFKRPGLGDGRSELQKREAKRLLAARIEYYLVDSIARGCEILGLKNRAADPHSALAKR